MPVLPSTTSPCCWSGDWDSEQKAGCSLESQHGNYLELARSPEHSRRVRKQALFWLAQSDKEADIEALTQLLQIQ